MVAIPVKLELGGLVDTSWAEEIAEYDDPTLSLELNSIQIRAANGERATGIPIPDSEYVWSEYKRGWNGALMYAEQRFGIDLSSLRKA